MKCVFWKCSCSETVKHIDRKWCFLKSPDYIFWYSSLTFSKKKKEMKKFLIWKKNSNFFWSKFFFKFFLKFFEKFLNFLNPFLGWFKAKKKNFRKNFEKFFRKNFEKNFWPKKIRFFFQIEIFFIFIFFFAKVSKAWT